MSKLKEKFLEVYSLNTLRDAAIAAPLGNSILCYNSGTSKWENIKAESHYYEDETLSLTTSATFVDKINQTTPSLQGGTYKVGFSCEISNTKKAATVAYMSKVNGTIISDGLYAPVDNDQFLVISGHKEVVLPAGTANLVIQFARPSSDTAEIRRARIWIERVLDR